MDSATNQSVDDPTAGGHTIDRIVSSRLLVVQENFVFQNTTTVDHATNNDTPKCAVNHSKGSKGEGDSSIDMDKKRKRSLTTDKTMSHHNSTDKKSSPTSDEETPNPSATVNNSTVVLLSSSPSCNTNHTLLLTTAAVDTTCAPMTLLNLGSAIAQARRSSMKLATKPQPAPAAEEALNPASLMLPHGRLARRNSTAVMMDRLTANSNDSTGRIVSSATRFLEQPTTLLGATPEEAEALGYDTHESQHNNNEPEEARPAKRFCRYQRRNSVVIPETSRASCGGAANSSNHFSWHAMNFLYGRSSTSREDNDDSNNNNNNNNNNPLPSEELLRRLSMRSAAAAAAADLS